MVGMEGLGVALNLYKFDIEFDRQTLPKVEFDIELIRSFVPEPTSGPHIMNLFVRGDLSVRTRISLVQIELRSHGLKRRNRLKFT